MSQGGQIQVPISHSVIHLICQEQQHSDRPSELCQGCVTRHGKSREHLLLSPLCSWYQLRLM